MILYPAIDLKDGACVRLRQGEMDQATVFNQDPGAQAKQFADAGCNWVHVVDLNGAFEGKPVTGAAVDAVAFNLRTACVSPRFQQVGDGGKLVENGPS